MTLDKNKTAVEDTVLFNIVYMKDKSVNFIQVKSIFEKDMQKMWEMLMVIDQHLQNVLVATAMKERSPNTSEEISVVSKPV